MITQGKQQGPDSNGFFFLSSEVLAETELPGKKNPVEGHATVSPGDPFAVSKAMFAALADELAGPAAAGLTAFELEELVDEESRKAVRQLVQDHYDLRALREEQRARKHPGPVAGTDGITRARLEAGHGRK